MMKEDYSTDDIADGLLIEHKVFNAGIDDRPKSPMLILENTSNVVAVTEP